MTPKKAWEAGMLRFGALLIVLAGVCQGISTIYGIPEDERKKFGEVTDRATTAWMDYKEDKSPIFLWLFLALVGFIAFQDFIYSSNILETLIGIFALSFTAYFIVKAIALIGSAVITGVITNRLSGTTKTAMQVAAILLGIVGTIIVFLATYA
jgi:hypothetical protein